MKKAERRQRRIDREVEEAYRLRAAADAAQLDLSDATGIPQESEKERKLREAIAARERRKETKKIKKARKKGGKTVVISSGLEVEIPNDPVRVTLDHELIDLRRKTPSEHDGDVFRTEESVGLLGEEADGIAYMHSTASGRTPTAEEPDYRDIEELMMPSGQIPHEAFDMPHSEEEIGELFQPARTAYEQEADNLIYGPPGSKPSHSPPGTPGHQSDKPGFGVKSKEVNPKLP